MTGHASEHREIEHRDVELVLSRGGADTVDVRFRTAAGGDLDGLYALSRPFMTSGALIPRDREFFGEHAEELFVLEAGGDLAGCAGLSRVGDTAEIYNVAVTAQWQGLGLGRILLACMVGAARREGYAEVVLFSRTTTGWFARQGFTPADPAVLPAGRLSLLDASRESTLLRRTIPPLGSGEVLEALTAPRVRFARTGDEYEWDWEDDSLLRFAEGRDVEVESLCWAGVCGTCATGLKQGSVVYHMAPDVEPDNGEVLLCVSQPATDLVVDL
ncbi:GNAT family N-acetyltransferase [Spirillospora sp. NPDC047279]|uniref:GNAT family N-acetyltransferase n=1 Tax=Spirillospora sp. NPDC047279 TaxID=3155478 RepID=UPI0033F3692C